MLQEHRRVKLENPLGFCLFASLSSVSFPPTLLLILPNDVLFFYVCVCDQTDRILRSEKET